MYGLYVKVEGERVKRAIELTKVNNITPDPMCRFVVERTDVCPHKLVTLNSQYWIDTVNILDGEMSLTLPYQMDQIPGVFFDALSVVRQARSIVSEEEKKKVK